MNTTEHDIFCDCQPCLDKLVADLHVLNHPCPPPVDFGAADRDESAPVTIAAPFSGAQIEKAVELIEHGQIVRDGRVYRVTASDGHTHYDVDPYRQTCTCTAGQHGRRCYHLAAASYLAAA